jgi:hypothetical protein
MGYGQSCCLPAASSRFLCSTCIVGTAPLPQVVLLCVARKQRSLWTRAPPGLAGPRPAWLITVVTGVVAVEVALAVVEAVVRRLGVMLWPCALLLLYAADPATRWDCT